MCVHMYDLLYVCLDNAEIYRMAIPEKHELEELTVSGELLMMKNYVTHTDIYL